MPTIELMPRIVLSNLSNDGTEVRPTRLLAGATSVMCCNAVMVMLLFTHTTMYFV